ncbi:hypothetical protein [Segeticoccus rhizosphaerae]|jgi:hypothetical protein|uniref:hypothetical protein n=1 Tax=Segeticoccus rhizosphaerae TaxID=1104777 RepID=UPI0010C0BE8A|nr:MULTISPECIES: hypothetical protein [Intrasporangiaceae]
MQRSERSTLDASDDAAPLEVVGGESYGTVRRQRLPDGVRAALYVLFGIVLAAFLIGIWPLMEVLQAPPLPK